jgi:hypothetical protein
MNLADLDTREKALVFVLYVLRTPFALMSPDRATAIDAATKYDITATDLLVAARRKAEGA